MNKISRHDILQKELFREKSTYRDDYRQYPICNRVEDTFKCIEAPLPGCTVPPPPPVDNQTLLDHTTPVPFNLFHEPKDVVKTNPHCYKPKFPPPQRELFSFEKGSGEESEQKPPLHTYGPAYPLTELENILDNDKDIINSIRNFPYLTTYCASYAPKDPPQECRCCVPYTTFKDKVADYPIHKKPLPLGWRNAARQWDHRQTRAVCDPTSAFWHRHYHDRYKREKCYENMYQRNPGITRKIRSLAHDWKLTEPYTTPVPNYLGYLPTLPKGVGMEKCTWCTHDPRMSSNQAYRVRMDAHGKC